MRWIYSDQSSQEEKKRRKHILNQIECWWSVFEKRQSEVVASFRKENKWDLASWMHDNLQKIDQNLIILCC